MSNGSLPGWGPEAGMTTMLNPLDTEKILIFSTNRNRTLALEHRKIGGDINYKKGSAELPAPGPQLAYPSSLVSFVLDGSVCVYGVTTEKRICLLSPVFEPVRGARVTNTMLGGCVDGKKVGWLFYDCDGRLYEQELSRKSDGGSSLKIKDYIKGTKLSAFYDGKSRWLVYQEEDKTIALWNCTTSKSSSIDNSSKFARCCTDVTACVVPADPQASRPARIYVYFVDEMNHLYRAYADVAKDLSFTDVDQRPKQVFQGKLEGDCQLSVFSYPAEGKNLVYAIKQGSEDYKISEIEDVFVEA